MRVTAPSGIPSRLLLVSWTQGPGRRRRVARDLPPESSIGLSRARENRTFRGLALDAALIRHNVDPRCGLIVIDLKDGAVVEWVRIEGIVDELYDVAVLPSHESLEVGPDRQRHSRSVPASWCHDVHRRLGAPYPDRAGDLAFHRRRDRPATVLQDGVLPDDERIAVLTDDCDLRQHRATPLVQLPAS